MDGQDVSLQLPLPLLAALDAYAERLGMAPGSRAELIRRLLEDRMVHEGLIDPAPDIGTRE